MFFKYVLLYFIYSNFWGGEVLMPSTYYEDYEGRCYYCERLNGHFYVDMGIKTRQLGMHNIFRFFSFQLVVTMTVPSGLQRQRCCL